MKSFIFFILGLTAGAVGGVVVTKYICDAKAEAKITEATAEARNFYKDKYEQDSKNLDKKIEKKAYEELTKSYTDDRIFGSKYDIYCSDTLEIKKHELDEHDAEKMDRSHLYLIDSSEAGMDDGYASYSLDYYQDGTLVDEEGNVVDEPLDIAGDFLDDLSLENPEIYVRNDATKVEYDICYIAASYEQPGGVYD